MRVREWDRNGKKKGERASKWEKEKEKRETAREWSWDEFGRKKIGIGRKKEGEKEKKRESKREKESDPWGDFSLRARSGSSGCLPSAKASPSKALMSWVAGRRQGGYPSSDRLFLRYTSQPANISPITSHHNHCYSSSALLCSALGKHIWVICS